MPKYEITRPTEGHVRLWLEENNEGGVDLMSECMGQFQPVLTLLAAGTLYRHRVMCLFDKLKLAPNCRIALDEPE